MLAAALCFALTARALGDDPAPFGFKDLEIYKPGHGASDLECADLDGDGLVDLALIDHRRSRIVLLLRRAASEPDAPFGAGEASGPNKIEFDGRYDVVRRAVERRVRQLALGDFDRDGRADAAWVLDGGELVVSYSGEGGAEARSQIVRVDDLSEGASALEAVDLDADGALDLVAAGPSALLWLRGKLPGGFAAPERLDALESGFGELFIADFDGDRRRDLLYVYYGADDPFRYRLQTEPGRFGPRYDVDLPPVRSAHAIDLDQDGKSEVLAVFKLSGRLAALELAPLPAGRRLLARFPLRASEKRSQARSFAAGDLDGDGAAEIVAVEGELSQVTRYRAARGSHALAVSADPTLVGASDACIADLDGDGRLELVVRSSSERMLGVSRVDASGAFAFPRTYPIDGDPVALACADVDGDGLADALVCVAQGEGRNRKHRLEVWRGGPSGLLAPTAHALEGLARTPNALCIADLDRDGALDALAFLPGERAVPALIFQRNGSFLLDERGEDSPGLGLLAGATPLCVNVGDVDGDGAHELLAATANFVRALTLEADANGRRTPRVLEQIAGPAPDSRILGAIALGDWNEANSAVALRDERTRELLVYARAANGRFELATRCDTDRIDFQGLARADVDGDGARDIVVFGANQFGVLFAGGSERQLVDFASFEPEKETFYLDRVAAGDLNHDGANDVVVSELSKHGLVLLDARARGLRRALGFEVFEQKSASGGESEGREPREMLCVELDGDGKTDLALLVHDKLLVYLQE